MNEKTENTLTAYLGPDFQQRLMWQLLVEPEFAEKILPNLAVEYFDDPNMKRLFIIMLEYLSEYQKVPNLQNKSVHQAISEYKTPNNTIEEESLFGVIKRIELWNERIINKQMLYDGDAVQKAANFFIKQQEYRKLAEHVQGKVKDGGIRNKYTVAAIEERFTKISHIGEDDDDGELLTEGIDKALRKEFRETIPTGIGAIDELTGGGLGKGEIGVILAPSGVGKTTALTIIANTAYECEKNVAHIVFEDTKDQIKRKHYTIWANSALSRLNDDDENERVRGVVLDKVKKMEGKGRLIVKRFSQEDTTMRDIRNWMTAHEKKWGFKFDMLVIDYLDCVESHKKSPDRTEAELTVVKGFEALASDFDIPAWTAIQSNRSGIGAEYVEAQQTGGSIKRMQKAHFFMSIAKTQAQQEANFANIRIIKARFAKDGQMFEDCVFNNDTIKIIIDDPRYRNSKSYKSLKQYDDDDVENIEKKLDAMNDKSSQAKLHAAISQKTEEDILNRINSDKINDLLRENAAPEDDIKPNTEFHPDVKSVHVSGRNDLNHEEKQQLVEFVNEIMAEDTKVVTEDILELDGDISDAPSDAVIGVISEGVRDETLLDFSGDTETIIVNEPPVVEKQPIYKSPGIPAVETSTVSFTTSDAQSLEELESQLIDPDEPQGSDEEFNRLLVKKRDYQTVIKKE